MVLTAERFFDGERQSGVLVRDERPGELATFISFGVGGDDVYAAEQVTEIGEASTDWTTFRFTERLSGAATAGVRTADGVDVAGVRLPRDAVPSYLAYRVLRDLATSGGERATFAQVDEHGEPRVRDVEVVLRGTEEVVPPGGAALRAARFDLLLDGAPYTRFWLDGDRVAVSDWTSGAMSALVDDVETALAGCPATVAPGARAWLASRPA
jgi:hypothetical protein